MCMGANLYAQLFSFHSYRFLLTARVSSRIGYGVLQLAAIWYVMSFSHNNPFAVSGLVFIQTIPFVLFGLYAGIKTDRWNAKGVMIGAETGRALIWAIAGVLSAVDRLPIVWLLFAIFLDGLCGSFFSPAFRAATPKLVPRELLQPANALLNIARDGTLIVSPGILALLLTLFHSERDIFLFPALTYLVSAISLSLMGFSVNSKIDRGKAVTWWESFRKDFSDIVTTIKIIAKAGQIFRAMIANIVSIVGNTVGWEVSLPILVRSHLGLSIVNYGEIVGALSFGSVVFGFLLGMFPMIRRLPTIFVGISLWGIGLALIGVGHNLMFAVVGAIVMALEQALQGLNIIVLLQQTYSEHVASIFSGYHGLQYAGNVLGSIVAGPILATIPVGSVITIGGGVIILVGISGWLQTLVVARA